MKIGYIGLGNMGSALARRLLRSHELVVFDVDPRAVDALVVRGAAAASTVKALGEQCEVIFLCLPTSEEVRAVIEGEGGLVESVRSGTLIVDQTTGAPDVTRSLAADLAARGVDLIDAPVSGGPFGADAGTVAIMVGADDAQFQAVEPILQTISPNITHAGGVGTGHAAKLVNNALSAGHRALSLEALALAAKAGVDLETMVDILLSGSGRNFFIETFARDYILAGDLDSPFTLQLPQKDLRTARKLADDLRVSMPLAAAVEQFYTDCINQMGADTPANYAAAYVDRRSGTHMVGAAARESGE